MNIIKDIKELVDSNVISQETANKIIDYYSKQNKNKTNRLFTIFGILGALLIGLGIILIIAHNWDNISRTTKTIFAIFPLLLGQAICIYVLIKKQDCVTWKESGATFLFFTVGASISLISQIYNMPGNLSSFLLIWMLLCFPLIYVMKSSIASLLFLIGITCYACFSGYWTYHNSPPYFYWILLLAIIPHYFLLQKKNPNSNFIVFHNWLIPLSLIISLGTIANRVEELMLIAYFNLFGLIYLIGDLDFFTKQIKRNNSYKIYGSIGTVSLLITLTFDWFWEDLRNKNFTLNNAVYSPEFFASTLLFLFTVGLFIYQSKKQSIRITTPIKFIFVLFIPIFIIGIFSSLSILITNIIVFSIGILTIKDGIKQENLKVLNYGLLIITFLILCRFFDTDLSFVIRGIIFVLIGVGFFGSNYWMIKKRNTNE